MISVANDRRKIDADPQMVRYTITPTARICNSDSRVETILKKARKVYHHDG